MLIARRWSLDADFASDNGLRVVQCSAQFGTKITSATPGSAPGLYLIVSDIEAARKELVGRGVEVSDVLHAGIPGAQFRPDGTSGRVIGPVPNHASYRSFASFSDPDGNGWLFQEVTTRLPGRIDSATISYRSPSDLASALGRAEAAHGEHERLAGRDANWSPIGTPRTWQRSKQGPSYQDKRDSCHHLKESNYAV